MQPFLKIETMKNAYNNISNIVAEPAQAVTQRRNFSKLAKQVHKRFAMAALLCVAAGGAAAQGYPDRMIKLVVPFPPGGPTDVASRIISQKMSEGLKQQIVVENRAGASGMIGAEAVAKSAPDGYTLMMLATPTLLFPHLSNYRGTDLFKDFTAIGSAYDLPIVMVVNPSKMPDVNSLQDLIAKAKE